MRLQVQIFSKAKYPSPALLVPRRLDHIAPEQAVLQKEKLRRLGNAMRSLTDVERECLLLRAGGLRYREIAEVLDLSTSTVGDTVDRAIRKLAEKCDV